MSAHLLLDRLSAACLVATLLCLLMLAARRSLRRVFGAELAYASWLLLPLLVACCMLPAHREYVAMPPLSMSVSEQAPTGLRTGVAASATDVTAFAVAAWLGGSALALLLSALRQGRFVRSLGALTAKGDGIFVSERDAGPLLIGLFAPRIVLPPDFAARYDASEQALVLAHERAHWQRGDLLANALAELLLALFWFNPLAYRARAAFLLDQEMACDAAVLRTHGASRKQYASALLKAQTTATRLPVGCTMQAHQPIKERIMHLNQQAPGVVVRRLFQTVVAAATIGAGCAAWALTAEQVMVTPAPAPLAAPAPVAQAAPTASPKAAPTASPKVATQAAPRPISPEEVKVTVDTRPPPVDFLRVESPGGMEGGGKAAADAAPPDDAVYKLAADISVDGGPTRHEEMTVKNNFAFTALSDGEGKPCELSGSVQGRQADQIVLSMLIACAGKPVSAPRLMVKEGEAATITFGRNGPQAAGMANTRGFVIKLQVNRG